MIKTKGELIADSVYRVLRKARGVSIPNPRRAKFERIPADNFKKKLQGIFNEIFVSHDFDEYEHSGRNLVWIREKSEIISNKLDINTIEKFLPTHFGIMTFVEVCSPQLINLINRHSDRNLDANSAVLRIRLADIFPRNELELDSSFDLESFGDIDDVDECIYDVANLIIEKSERFYSSFATYDDLLKVYRDSIYPWGKNPTPYLPFKKVITGLIYFVGGNNVASKEYFQGLVDECSTLLKNTDLETKDIDRLKFALMISNSVLCDLG